MFCYRGTQGTIRVRLLNSLSATKSIPVYQTRKDVYTFIRCWTRQILGSSPEELQSSEFNIFYSDKIIMLGGTAVSGSGSSSSSNIQTRNN